MNGTWQPKSGILIKKGREYMVKDILLNDKLIEVQRFEYKEEERRHEISIDFKVKSEEYHDMAMLLYQGIFDVHVPEKNLLFKGKIVQYSTSITNLYEKNQIGDYFLTLREIQD